MNSFVVILLERYVGPGWSGYVILMLALALPLVAIGWLSYQHFRNRKR
jgi:hypothetical protein